jgi:O-antigen/teichoic acid export membrane protein
VNVIVTISALYAQFAALGFANVTLKFFPFFRSRPQQHHGYLTLISAVSLGGFVLFGGLLLIFKRQVVDFFEGSPAVLDYLWYVIPLTLFALFYNVLFSYLRSLNNTVMSSLLKDFVQKVLISLCIGLFAFKLVDFPTFVVIYVGANVIITLLLLIYTWRIGELHFAPKVTMPGSLHFKPMLVYGLLAFLGNAGSFITGKVDTLILTRLTSDLGVVGVYATVFAIISAIEIPSRSMYKIASPQVAEYWASKNMRGLERLYKRTSLINTIIASILFIGIWVNVDNILSLMPPAYAAGKWVILILGIGKLFDLMTGLNGFILLTSDRYKWDFAFNITLVGLVIGLDYWLIPIYGIEGAAIGTMLALVLFNLSRVFFVLYFYKMHPFGWRIAVVLLIGGLALLPGLLLPQMPLLIDIFVRSSIVSIIFFSILYFLRISEDANRVGNRILRWVGMGR